MYICWTVNFSSTYSVGSVRDCFKILSIGNQLLFCLFWEALKQPEKEVSESGCPVVSVGPVTAGDQPGPAEQPPHPSFACLLLFSSLKILVTLD